MRDVWYIGYSNLPVDMCECSDNVVSFPSSCRRLVSVFSFARRILCCLIVPAPASQHTSSVNPSASLLYFARLVCPHACQHPSRTAAPVSVCPSGPEPPGRLMGICLRRGGEGGPGGRSGYWMVLRLVLGEARRARPGRVYESKDHGRERRLGGRARGCRGLVVWSWGYQRRYRWSRVGVLPQ
jgi:hypothetical protein